MKRARKAAVLLLTLCVLFSSTGLHVEAWGSSENIYKAENTHVWLIEQGMNILQNDLSDQDRNNSNLMAVINRLDQSYLETLKHGSVAPDFGDHQYLLYQDHFWDPDTKVNFSATWDMELTFLEHVNDTAESRSREYVGLAVYEWRRGNEDQAAYYLGEALHFFTDLCNPHHGSNAIGGEREPFTKHQGFETYVDNNLPQFSRVTLGGNTSSSAYATGSYRYLADWIRDEAYDRAKLAKGTYNTVFSPSNQGTWQRTAEITVESAQACVARTLYQFAREVVKPAQTTGSNVDLDVRIRTKAGSLWDTYGTDNSVYFGVELKDGRLQEWYLDKSYYNDFEKGDNDTYTVTLKGARGLEIRKIWVRKSRGISDLTAEDNWRPEEIQVTSRDGGLNYTRRIDRWLTGNNGFYMDVKNGELITYPDYNE